MLKADLSGKKALVTGASSGLGAHFARALAQNGAEVIVAARRVDRLEMLVEEIQAKGGKASPLALDVTDVDQINEAVASAGLLDIVVNNAGVAGDSNTLATEPDEWKWTYDVNVHGVWFVTRAAAQRMIAEKAGGSIINIASITGLRAASGVAAYASSKAAIVHLTKNLALDWARYGIRVNAIAPGYFETDINRDFLVSDFGQTMIKRIPQRRVGRVDELEGALLLLASDASTYMTGSVIAVDGGHVCSTL